MPGDERRSESKIANAKFKIEETFTRRPMAVDLSPSERSLVLVGALARTLDCGRDLSPEGFGPQGEAAALLLVLPSSRLSHNGAGVSGRSAPKAVGSPRMSADLHGSETAVRSALIRINPRLHTMFPAAPREVRYNAPLDAGSSRRD